MKPEARKYLVDIMLSIEIILEYIVEPGGFSAFANNQL